MVPSHESAAPLVVDAAMIASVAFPEELLGSEEEVMAFEVGENERDLRHDGPRSR